MSWRVMAAVAAVVAVVIVGVYLVAVRSAPDEGGGAALPPAVESAAAPPCAPGPRGVAASRVSTGLVNARLERGDSDIASNDWTRLEIGYTLELDSLDRTLRIRLAWSAQEANADRSLASSRIRSERVLDLYAIPVECPGLVIAGVGTLEVPGAPREHWVEGQQHDFVAIPDVGALRNIFVRFDGPGGGDERRQALQADLPPFELTLAAR